MLATRSVLAVAMILVGAVVIVRMAGLGISLAIVPGLILGGAMTALGFYRLRQIRNARTMR